MQRPETLGLHSGPEDGPARTHHMHATPASNAAALPSVRRHSPHGGSAIVLSIIIVNWNTRELLRHCLQSVFMSTDCADLEVIVVDNGSNDGSVDMVAASFPQVLLVANAVNRGFAAANNIGIARASGKFLLLLNSDTIVRKGTFDACLDHMACSPNVGALGCRVVYPDDSFQSSYFRSTSLLELFLFHCMGFWLVVFLVRKFLLSTFNYPSRYWGAQFNAPTKVDGVAGCFLLVRRDAISQAGVLDEDFFFYGEEEEWCSRIRSAGWSVVYFPGAEIIHLHGASSKLSTFSTSLAARRARLMLLKKTQGAAVAWLANLIMTFGVIMRIPFWCFSAVFRWARSRGSDDRLAPRLELMRFHFAALVRAA